MIILVYENCLFRPLQRAKQNSDCSLSVWENIGGHLPVPANLVLTSDNQVYAYAFYNFYKANFDPLTGTIGSFTTDSRPLPEAACPAPVAWRPSLWRRRGRRGADIAPRVRDEGRYS